jgi:hypothetical protein
MEEPKISRLMRLTYDFDDLEYEAWLDEVIASEEAQYDEDGGYIGGGPDAEA